MHRNAVRSIGLSAGRNKMGAIEYGNENDSVHKTPDCVDGIVRHPPGHSCAADFSCLYCEKSVVTEDGRNLHGIGRQAG